MSKTEYEFSADEIESKLSEFASMGITELSVHDGILANDRGRILRMMRLIQKNCPDLLFTIRVEASAFDRDVCRQASEMNCTIDMPFHPVSNDGKTCLLDKKMYAGRAGMMNDTGLVFGFIMDYASVPGDSFKLFRDRLDFAVSLYPNHIDFPETENVEKMLNSADIPVQTVKPTALFAAQDIRYARDISFACRTFYSAGRAVPWFLPVLQPLKISASSFFSDFAEWQHGSNCNYRSGFIPEQVNHKEIEKMQLLFLGTKYDEKGKSELMPVVRDIVMLNGAFSRLTGENEESVVTTAYNPDDLLGPESSDILSFAENVCMEESKVKIFYTPDGPDYKII
ncbi:MAG: hypothetical protein M0P01_08315 [Treponema sp.]|nr:hypothetical protein [Treponema sp.]